MTAKKVIRAQNIAIENRIPTIYLVDSAGVFLPLQEDVFPDTDDFGRVFRNNAVMSALGIPQIAAIMGMCVAGGGYLPVMCDHVLMTDGSGLFLAGPALVQAAIGQKVSAEELGGAAMHSAISGSVDFREPNDQACLARIRSLIDKWGYRRQSIWDRKKPVDPVMPAEEIYGAYDASPARPYDMKEILARIVDESRFDEYKPEYGKTLICGYARIGGFAVGIVANQKLHAHQTDHEGHKRVEFGGVIYTESAEKAARFIMDCNQSLIPLVFFHDVNGFMVGRDAEWSGIIKAGAKMVSDEVLAWKGGAALYRSVLAHEKGNAAEFERHYANALARFKEAEAAQSSPGNIARHAITGGSLVIFADRLPEKYRTAAWTTAYDMFGQIWTAQAPYVTKLPVHARGELLSGLAVSSQRLGKAGESVEHLDRMMTMLQGTPYEAGARKWKENPEAATKVRITCMNCHDGGRLEATRAALDKK